MAKASKPLKPAWDTSPQAIRYRSRLTENSGHQWLGRKLVMSKQSLGYKLLAGLVAATMLLTGCSAASKGGNATCEEFRNMSTDDKLKVTAKVLKPVIKDFTDKEMNNAVMTMALYCSVAKPDTKLREIVEQVEQQYR